MDLYARRPHLSQRLVAEWTLPVDHPEILAVVPQKPALKDRAVAATRSSSLAVWAVGLVSLLVFISGQVAPDLVRSIPQAYQVVASVVISGLTIWGVHFVATGDPAPPNFQQLAGGETSGQPDPVPEPPSRLVQRHILGGDGPSSDRFRGVRPSSPWPNPLTPATSGNVGSNVLHTVTDAATGELLRASVDWRNPFPAPPVWDGTRRGETRVNDAHNPDSVRTGDFRGPGPHIAAAAGSDPFPAPPVQP